MSSGAGSGSGNPQHRASHRRRHSARRHRHRNRSSGAGQRRPDQHAGAEHDAEKPLRARHQREAQDVKHRADHHDGAKAVAHRHCAGQRLQESPGQVLHRDREGEIGDGYPDIMGQRLQEDAEALAQAHAQAEHQGSANQNGKRGTKHLQQGHDSCSFFAGRKTRRSSVASGLITQTCVIKLRAAMLSRQKEHRSV